MRVFCSILLMCFTIKLSEQLNDLRNASSNGSNTSNGTLDTPSYSFDTQIAGFTSDKLTSGPIVLVDTRTLFVPDLQYKDSQKEVEFWVGPGISPYNDSGKRMVSKELLASSKNLYISLPEDLTLNDITYFQAMSKNESLDYVLFKSEDKKTVKTYDGQDETVFRFPKCCSADQYMNDTIKDCSTALKQLSMNINIFESNETGLDPDVRLNASTYRLVPFIQACPPNYMITGPETDLHGLIYNASLIVKGTGMFSYRDYCYEILAYDNGTTETFPFTCNLSVSSTSEPTVVYLIVLIISMIGFALSAIAYIIILRRGHIHKRCFIIFSSSMCLAFLSLIVMKLQDNNPACYFFGFAFLITKVFSFFWLLISCLELLYLVKYPIESSRYYQRWYWYLGISVGLTVLIFLVSLFSGELWVPDVPNSFLMNNENQGCQFQTTYARTFIIFTPMILSIVLSIVTCIAITTFINKNEANANVKDHFDWHLNRNTYKFVSRTYYLIIIVAALWLVNIFFYDPSSESIKTLALDVIKASLGIITFCGCVLNKYTRKELWNKLTRKRHTYTEEGQELRNGIPTPDNSAEPDHSVRPSNNLSSFQNHRSG